MLPLLRQQPQHPSLSLSSTFPCSGSLPLSSSSSIPSHTLPNQVVPNLKTSLSHTLHHFLPLAGSVVWPSDSPAPFVQYTPGDVVSLVVAESDADFDHLTDYSPHEATLSRSLVHHLDSSDSRASVVSLQITLFPNKGFSIGVSAHHGVLDGKSSTLFVKAWTSLCQANNENETQKPSLVQGLEPFFDRTVIKKPTHLGDNYTEYLTSFFSKLFPGENSNPRCLRILPFLPRLKGTVRATFALTRGDLEKIKKRVLSKWDVVEESDSKPPTLSSFVLSYAHALVCMAKAIHGVEREKQKFSFAFPVDCRARLEPQVPSNYCGNCVWSHLVDAEPLDFIKEEGVVIVAKSIHRKVKKLGEQAFNGTSGFADLAKEGVQTIGASMSNRFGFYGTDFGWGKPAKVELTSMDRGLSIGLAEGKDGSGGVEVCLVLNKHEMDLFAALFREGL
ncbi:phenolic glucoside malonyltransferase 1-like [Cajanus cajan]|uniref:phenolic glucoside malonyltransferase 1-like n=1 Tax=Cajanus cajan TaxID=3821 RepID=UPI0010FAFCFC|nr:phenolic glucoside malonyltransferase 1-like [Cajanus cajan]